MKTLQALKEDSATGPDLLPTRICVGQIAVPFRMLAELILWHGAWPMIWKSHWIVHLFKKGAVFQPGNYMGNPFHVATVQGHETVSRVHGRLFRFAYCYIGPTHFAYQKARGAIDALAYTVLTYISGFTRTRSLPYIAQTRQELLSESTRTGCWSS